MDRPAARQIVLSECALALDSYESTDREESIEILIDALLTEGPWMPAVLHSPAAEGERPLPHGHPRLIGLRGAPRAGKDVVAASLVATYGDACRLAFSEPILEEVNAFLGPHGHRIVEQNKSHIPYRRALQQWATMRKLEDSEYWASQVKAMISRLWAEGYTLVVATGVRDLSDVGAIRDLGGEIWHVQRPGVIADTTHPRERQLEGIEGIDDVVLENPSEGDLGPLRAAADRALRRPRG